MYLLDMAQEWSSVSILEGNFGLKGKTYHKFSLNGA